MIKLANINSHLYYFVNTLRKYCYSPVKRFHPVTQRGVFATQIIRTILTSTNPENVSDSSLADLIQKIKFDEKVFVID